MPILRWVSRESIDNKYYSPSYMSWKFWFNNIWFDRRSINQLNSFKHRPTSCVDWADVTIIFSSSELKKTFFLISLQNIQDLNFFKPEVNSSSGLSNLSYLFYLCDIVWLKWTLYEHLSLSNLSMSPICFRLLSPSFFAYPNVRSKRKGNNRHNRKSRHVTPNFLRERRG